MGERYLKQVIVVRKDLSMPTGKLAAMAAHAAMTFLLARLSFRSVGASDTLTDDQVRWLTELDPGIEETEQVSMAKIVVQVLSLEELLAVKKAAHAAGLECHRVTDSGYSYNKVGDVPCIAIGPDWPERLDPVTGHLKVYR